MLGTAVVVVLLVPFVLFKESPFVLLALFALIVLLCLLSRRCRFRVCSLHCCVSARFLSFLSTSLWLSGPAEHSLTRNKTYLTLLTIALCHCHCTCHLTATDFIACRLGGSRICGIPVLLALGELNRWRGTRTKELRTRGLFATPTQQSFSLACC